MQELKQLSKQLLAATKSTEEAFLKSMLSTEGKCCSELYKYVRSVKKVGKIFLSSKTAMDRTSQIR